MYINKVNNTNFQAIYKIKSTPAIIEEIEHKMIPIYENVSNQTAYAVVGNNPFKLLLTNTIERIAKANNCSTSWVEMNAKNHGIDLSNAKEEIMYVLSGNKEISDLMRYMVKRNKNLRPNLINRIKMLFMPQKDFIRPSKPIPEYLRPLLDALNYDKNETLAFDKYIKNRVEAVGSTKELFMKMMRER